MIDSVSDNLEERCLSVSGVTASHCRGKKHPVIIRQSRTSNARVGDYLLQINGMCVDYMSNRTIADLLSTVGTRINIAGNNYSTDGKEV